MLKAAVKHITGAVVLASLAACATTPQPQNFLKSHPPKMDPADQPKAKPLAAPKSTPPVKTPPKAAPAPPPEKPAPDIKPESTLNSLTSLPYWKTSNHLPALASFKRSCGVWEKAEPTSLINPNLPDYGLYSDWLPLCAKALKLADNKDTARMFFEKEFATASLSSAAQKPALLTGYYQPEIPVRRKANAEFSEPILSVPKAKHKTHLHRKNINASTSRVIAYGRPIDVFFMQIQGSGHIRFKDGTRLRAAYAGNNGKPYKSIGRVLIDRREMTKEQASKQTIEKWMQKAGPKRTRALMNENPRYIFFEERAIKTGEGPMGAMRVPLTSMGSMAVDPRYHPYGTLFWVVGKVPKKAGDYKGAETGFLLSAQDTGKAIRGAMRGDLYFGTGHDAGARAGVMKHPAKWTVLLPKSLAARLAAKQPSA
ncbi:MAG: murein transglycosylase A [Maricaulaceae bacterium]